MGLPYDLQFLISNFLLDENSVRVNSKKIWT